MYLKKLIVTYKEDSVNIPYFEIKGKKEGPCIFLSGGMHGNEIGGIMAIEKFLEFAKTENISDKLAGKIIILPLLNPSGFSYSKRTVYEDNQDLNRSFGVDKIECLSHEIAYQLTNKLFKDCDFGIDFHDSGSSNVLLPHSRIHKNDLNGEAKKMGIIFGTEIIIERIGKKNMLAVYLKKKLNINVLTVEIGGAQKIFPKFIDTSLQGIKNILYHHKMLPGKIVLAKRQFLLYNRFGITITNSSIVTFSVKLGDIIHIGDKIGMLYFPKTATHKEIISPMCGIIFSLTQRNQIYKNKNGKRNTIFSILEKDDCHVNRTTLTKFKELDNLNIKQVIM